MPTLSRRGFFGAACVACGTGHLGFSATPVQAQTPAGWSPPAPAQRCPSRFGPNDRRGYMNLLTDAKRQSAARLITRGQVIELGHRLEPSMPFFGTRRFDMHAKRTFMNPEPNRRGSNEEIVISEIGQVGTQLDAFPHQTIGDQVYNCVPNDPNITRGGYREMGIDTVGTVFTRGVMIDVAKLKGVRTLPMSYEITVADLEQAIARQNLRLEPADAIIINTGWNHLWGVDNAQYVRGCPGIGIAAAEWLIAREPILLGSDNWPVEVAPNPDRNASLPVHQIALVVHGVHLLENMKLAEMSERDIGAFAFMMQPLKIAGGSGSTVAPSALL